MLSNKPVSGGVSGPPTTRRRTDPETQPINRIQSAFETDARFERILAKLQEARRRGTTCFGSEAHGFRLRPLLPAAELAGFESDHGIRLPEAHLDFLLRLGDGGAGPYYGLARLSDWIGDLGDAPERGFLASTCPLTPEVANRDDWQSRLPDDWSLWLAGTIHLCTQGCTYSARLVVSGPARGRVVYLDANGTDSRPYFPADPDFGAWYERWLDELLSGYDDSWFGHGLPGSEPDMVRVLADAASDDRLRGEALTTLLRMQSPAHETLDVVRALLGRSGPRPTAQAVHLLGKHRESAAALDVRSRLADPDSGVRQAALHALHNMPGEDWEPHARSVLGDPDCNLVLDAVRMLKDAGRLMRADVAALRRSVNADVRRNAEYWTGGELDTDIYDGVLAHENPMTRRNALLSARQRRERREAYPVAMRLRAEPDPKLAALAADVLAEIGDPVAAPFLIEATRHADQSVRLAAERALKRLESPACEDGPAPASG